MENARVWLAEIVPVGVLALYLLFRQWQRRREGQRPPIQEKLLRPAGYSLQCEIEKLNDRINTLLMIVAACSMSFSLILLTHKNGGGDVPLLVVLAAAAGICVAMTIRPIELLRSFRLGLLGERAMGEQLQALAIQGYRIFHDIPGNGFWNVDHAAVGPGGVFAIETKCYSKKPSRNGLKDHEAVFNGNVILFPWGNDSRATIQANKGAKWLASFLTSAVGERVAAQAVVALPGWYVTQEANSEAKVASCKVPGRISSMLEIDVKVLSGKQVAGYIRSMPEILSPKLIQQIAHQLDQRCRDVEF